MYVNEYGMLTAIDRTIKFRSLVPMNTRQHEEYYRALGQILRHYNQAGFVIKEIHCDGEFRSMMERVNDNLDVKMNFTNAQDHVPEAERNNQTIKERIRAAHHRLPYKALPRIMIRYLAMYQVNQLNLFPVKGGVSAYYSPRMILNQENLDYAKHCSVPFGA
jgi:predicted RNA-binding protein